MRIGFGAFSVLFLVLVFGVLGLVAFFSPPGPAGPDFPALNVQPVSPHYLLTNQGVESRLYFVSAVPRYGYFPEDPFQNFGQYQVHKGDPCFIVNVTIRNDYDSEHQLPPRYPGDNHTNVNARFVVNAKLYDKNGAINAPAVTPPYPQIPFGIPQFYQEGGSTETYEIYLATGNRNIDHYEVWLNSLGSAPVP